MYRLFGRPKEQPAPAAAAPAPAAPAPAAPIDTAAAVRDMNARRDELQARWSAEHENMFRVAKELKHPALPPFRKQQLMDEFKRCRFRKQGLETSLTALGDTLASLERSEMALQRGKDNLDMIKMKQQQLDVMREQIAQQEKAGYGVDDIEDLNDEMEEVAATQAELDVLNGQRARWDDPAYVRAQARDRLYYVMPGEISYLVINDVKLDSTKSVRATTELTDTNNDWVAGLLGSFLVAGLGTQTPAELAPSIPATTGG